MKRIYLAGPMSGLPQMNFPAFDAAALDLRARGYDVVSPAELDSKEARAAALASPDGSPDDYAPGDTWGTLLARDVKLIADEGIEAIAVLPGWEKSRGARLETFVARLCDLPIVQYLEDCHVLPPVDLLTKEEAHGALQTTVSSKPLGLSDSFVREIRTVNAVTGGEKGQKPEAYDLLPWEQLDEVARLYHQGAEKYAAHNWTKGYDWSLSFASLIRHATLFWRGNNVDEETGCSHLASVVFHALALMHFAQYHQTLDDRPPRPAREPF